METEVKEEDHDLDSYLRWQKTALEQLGYVINLFFTVAGAVLAFAVKTMMESPAPLPASAHCLFHASLLFLGTSIVSSLIANTTRAMDFRYTRRAAYSRWKKRPDHDALRDKAHSCGEWTWRLFYCQTFTLGMGALFLCVSIWSGYGHKI
jgi:hypothetical protein